MRVIRTEMYFDEVDGVNRSGRRSLMRDREEKNYGLAFAWFRGDDPGPFDIPNFKAFRVREIAIDDVPRALDALLREVDGRDLELNRERFDEDARNPQIVNFVYEQSIILEQSPPQAVLFKDILKKTNGKLYVGTFMGIGASYDYPALMFVTIPLGIIVVGSAMDVSEAMGAGLNKVVKRMFDRRKK
ncbi:MAG: hypothetical protein AAB403_11540 [Planctomycetota bacterium]